MSVAVWVVIITAIAGVGGTGLGGIVCACLRKDSDKMVSLFLSFASGVMLSIVCFDLIPEAMFQYDNSRHSGLLISIGGILLGYMIVFLLNNIIDMSANRELNHVDSKHPRTADALDELIHYDHYTEHKKRDSSYDLFVAGTVMAFAIALHNLPEGMVIGASYAAHPGENLYSGSGLILAVVIGLHNIPEGMAISVPLVSGGMPRAKAVFITALSGAPTIIGALIGYYMGTISPASLALALSFASGAMLYVVFGELLPESILMWKSKIPAFAVIVGIIVGLIIIFGG